jgi:hypothetical protein
MRNFTRESYRFLLQSCLEEERYAFTADLVGLDVTGFRLFTPLRVLSHEKFVVQNPMDLAALSYSPYSQINPEHIASGVPSTTLFMAKIILILVALSRDVVLNHS